TRAARDTPGCWYRHARHHKRLRSVRRAAPTEACRNSELAEYCCLSSDPPVYCAPHNSVDPIGQPVAASGCFCRVTGIVGLLQCVIEMERNHATCMPDRR